MIDPAGLEGRPGGGRVEPGGKAWRATIYEPGAARSEAPPAPEAETAIDPAIADMPCPVCALRGLTRLMDRTSIRSRECRCGAILLLPGL